MQRTLKNAVSFEGPGLHSGVPVSLRICPAPANSGIWFRRTDIVDGDPRIHALWSNVTQSRLCTLITNDHGVSVSTVEHVMAALAGCGVHNALIEVDGPELPILDGSAAPFVSAMLAAGLVEQDAPIQVVEVLKPVEVSDGEAWARLEPTNGFEIEFRIEFDVAAIGVQEKVLNMANGAFVRELCDSRTFCRMSDVTSMRNAGLAQGGTLANALVFEGEEILTPGGARHDDEPVRHKMLDALGDLALAGAPLQARMTAHRGGHALTNRLLHALFDDASAYRIREVDEATAQKLPGVGVHQDDIPAVA